MNVPVRVFVLDTGALIALERGDPRMTGLLRRVRGKQARFVVPDSVVAQAWRGASGRQARVASLLGLKSEYSTPVPLDTAMAKRIGAKIAVSGHPDVIDVHVAIAATDHHAVVITSDRADIAAIDSDLADRIVDV